MWALLPLATPFSILGWVGGGLLAQEVGGPPISDQLLAPLGAAIPFALLALWIIRRQEQVIDRLMAELGRVNGDQLGKVTGALSETAVLLREQSVLLHQVLDDRRRGP